MATAIVSGAIANKPLSGGEAWVRLSWLLGLQRLGFEVFFLEQIEESACVDARGRPAGFEASANLAHFESVSRDFGLHESASLRCGDVAVGGIEAGRWPALIGEADLLLNLSGHLALDEGKARPRRSVYVDLDPGFTQAWHADSSVDFAIPPHDHYVTVGTNIGAEQCTIPTCGIEWIGTLPPVVLERWPSAPVAASSLRFSTVATWRTPHGPLRLGDRSFAPKHHEFRRFLELPRRASGLGFELALDIHPADAADAEALVENGWRLADPREVAGTPQRFREYLSSSDAEFSVAHGAYVDTRSGWFSDRSAAYLACGRPVLVQDTGLTAFPSGEGMVTFRTPEEAIAGALEIAANSAAHAEAARALAVARLDSDVILGELLARIGVGR